MSKDTSADLTKATRAANISPEMLELMAKQAANLFMEEHIGLSESISKLAEAHEDINQEQIKRICEFANNAVYLAQHDQSKMAGEKVSYPEFDLADPARVVQNLSDGAESTTITQVDADYSRLPEKRQKVSTARSDELLGELFKSKTAEDLDYSKDSVINDVMAAKEQLVALRDHLSHSGEQLDLMKKEAEAEFYDLAKRHCLDGGSVADVFKAVASVEAEQEARGEVLSPVIKGFIKERVASFEKISSEMPSLKDALAHRIVNPEHPMVKSAAAIIGSGREIDVVATGLASVEAELAHVNAFIKEKLSA